MHHPVFCVNSYKACYRSDWPNWSRRGPTIFSIFAKDRISLIQKLSKYCSTRKQRATDGLEKQRKKILNNNNKIVVLSTLPYKN